MLSLVIVLYLLPAPAVWPPAWVGHSVTFVCLFVCILKGKRLELSTPNLIHVYSLVVARHALTQSSKGRGYQKTVARLLVMCSTTVVYCCCRHGSACRYDCLCFLVCCVLAAKNHASAGTQHRSLFQESNVE